MIVAPLSTLAHHVHRRPAAPGGWLAYSDGWDVRLFGAAPDWRMLACQAAHELSEACVLHHRGVTRDAIDAYDYATVDSPMLLSGSPYARAHRFATVIENALALELGLSFDAHSRVVEGIRERAVSSFALRQAP